MKKLAIAIAVFCFGISAQAQSIQKWKISDVEKYMGSKDGEVLVINFWATFCKPCVAEIPSFIKTVDKYKSNNVKLLLVSLDLPSYYPKKISTFAKKNDFDANIVWLDETNADVFCPRIDKSWSGSIPATIIINTKTGYKKFFEEEIDPAVFEEALQKAIAG